MTERFARPSDPSVQTPASTESRGHPQPRPVATAARGLRDLSMGQAATERLPYFGREGIMALPPRQRQRALHAMTRELTRHYKISIRRWRHHMSGMAYELTYADGRIKRLISAPRPRSSVSAAIFLHEVGHHAIGFKRYTCRCLEEYYVWHWTFREMRARQIPITERVLRHYRRSMQYYLRRAKPEDVWKLPVPPHVLSG
jgi:hypothetical protein